MEPEKLKKVLEVKYLAACREVRILAKAEKSEKKSGGKIANTVMSMLAAERKKTVLDIYALAFPDEALAVLIKKGLAVEDPENTDDPECEPSGEPAGDGEAA